MAPGHACPCPRLIHHWVQTSSPLVYHSLRLGLLPILHCTSLEACVQILHPPPSIPPQAGFATLHTQIACYGYPLGPLLRPRPRTFHTACHWPARGTHP